ANLIKYVIKTSRIHVGIAALGASRRAYMEAYEYSLIREAYGKKISQFPAVMRSLSEMKILQTALTHSVFLNLDYIEKKIKAEQVITPLLKYISSTHATWQTKEAIILLGGNGILGDFSCLPRLHNDSIINETWEGTHHIIADHVLHAFGRPQVKKSFEEELQKSTRDSESLRELSYSIGVYESKKDELDKLLQLSGEWIDMNRIAVCELIYGCFALSSLMEEAVAFKKDFPEKENIYALLANGYAEILYRGKSGFADPGGIFNSLEKMDSIIKF
ncbi:MAG: acyl-CoA dehydrogenase, partial [Leptospira sp.]|nr:acyl-CoA dehydrogenase [Leptospira sp.]